jgi:sterol desaturase/sphingolipid hydroxylase (fatty acid hydroxylase superfamily)
MSLIEVFSASFETYKVYFKYMLHHPAWDNPLYVIPAICLLTFLLEVFLPKKMNYGVTSRKGFYLDLFYVIFFDYLILLIGFYAFTSTVEYLFKELLGVFGITEYILWDMQEVSFFIQFIVVFLLLDFLQFFGHYLLHRIDFLWKFHKIHHAQEELGFASTRHFHWVEYFIFKPLLYLPFMTLNFSVSEFIAIYLWVGYGFTFFSHCNVRVPWKWMNYLLITPETHYWHHAKNLPEHRRYGVNFASTTTLWDHLFGFFYLPDEEKLSPSLGVDDQKNIPQTFIGQMIHPFKELFSHQKKKPSVKRGKKLKKK